MSLRKVSPDWPLILTALALSIFGMLMVYSAGQTEMPSFVTRLWKQQLIWFFISLLGAWAMARTSIRMLEWLTWPLYALSVLLLAALFIPGVGTGAGTAASTKSWLAIGGFRLGQPAELAKLTVVLMLARVLAANRDAPKTLIELWKPGLVVGVPWLLIMAQPDLGTGIVFIGILFGMLFWFGIPWPLLILVASPAVSLILAFSTTMWGAWFLLLVALVIWYRPFLAEGVFLVVSNVAMGVLAPLLWERLEPYQQKRLLVFLDPSLDPREAGYHVQQSKVAIGSGGVFGKGWMQGTQKELGFLPEQHTDFIFAVVGEELGFLGVMVALALFLILFLRVVRIAERANDAFSSLVAFGLLGGWFMHVLVNIGMTLSLMPITGIPLPFFSYGGSFMLASWLAIGILVRIANEGRGRNGGLAI
ncbi:MAG TPA: rod shape-determining protein RodA [Vicinamibacterales bacterium]|nr:rod shape-determining protein RodA [Vicinamibacterales bacterium]